jgi:hypothetical protein
VKKAISMKEFSVENSKVLESLFLMSCDSKKDMNPDKMVDVILP